MNICEKCGMQGGCGCLWESKTLCKKCGAAARKEALPLDIRMEMEEKQRAEARIKTLAQALVPPPIPATLSSDSADTELAVTDSVKTTLAPQKGVEHLFKILQGRDVFLLCGGPSLATMDLELLSQRGIVTMAINNAAALYRPNYWIGTDEPKRFVEQLWKDAGVTKLLPSYLHNRKLSKRNRHGVLGESSYTAGQAPNTFFYKIKEEFKVGSFLSEDGFCTGNKSGLVDELGIKASRTTMLTALKMLFYMGAKNVYIVGADFKMTADAQNYAFAQETKSGNVSSNNGIYSSLNKRLTALRPHFEANGFKVWNVTPESGLKAFPKLDYCEAVKLAARECNEKPIQTAGMYPVR